MVHRVTAQPSVNRLSTTSYLDDALGALWPEPATRRMVSRLSPRQAGTTDFVLLPSPSSPRLLLPRFPRRASARAARNYKASARSTALLEVRLMSLAARCGLTDLSGEHVRIHDPGRTGIDHYLSQVLGEPIVLGIYVGPSRAVQKPVLQVLSTAGETLAFAKVGLDDLTNSLVAHESNHLAEVGRSPRTVLRVPELLHHGQWHGHEILVQEAVVPGRRRPVTQPLLVAATVEVAAMGGVRRSSLAEHEYWATLRSRVEAQHGSDHHQLLSHALQVLDRKFAGTVLPFGSWHGDWAPWNMTRVDDELVAWDWELFETGVPLGYDAIHYAVQQAVVVAGGDPVASIAAVSRNAAGLLSPFGVRGDAAALTMVLYLTDIAARYLSFGEVDRGTVMGSLGWLDEALRAQLEALGG